MSRHRASHLVALLALAAASCQAPGVDTPVRTPRPSRSPAVTGAVSPSPSASPLPLPVTVDQLRAPAGTTSLKGSVMVDAGYLFASEAGSALSFGERPVVAAGLDLRLADAAGVVSKTRLIGDAGGSVVSKTRLIGEDGAAVVSKTRLVNPDGSPVVSKTRIIGVDGSPVVSKTRLLDADGVPIALADGNLISDAGSSLVSDAGGSAISNGGARLVANNGAGLLGKAKYGLAGAPRFRLAAGPVDAVDLLVGSDAPNLGALLPAAGMLVAARSLRTGDLVPIGVDSQGKPAYAAYTNLAGGYTFHLSPEEARNVLVVAVVPKVEDPRARYAQLAPVRASREMQMDEDTAQVTRAVRQVAAGRLASIFLQPMDRLTCEVRASKSTPEFLKDALTEMLEGLHGAAARAGVKDEPAQAAAVAELAGRCADVLLADLDLEAITCGPAPDNTDPQADVTGSPALAVLASLFKESRLSAQARLAGDPRYFESRPWFQAANACDPGRYAILKPADFSTYVIEEYIANNSDPGFFYLADALRDMGYPTSEFGYPHAVRKLVRALDATLVQVMLSYQADADRKARVQALIAAYDPAARVLGKGFRVPCPRPARTPGPVWSPTPTPQPCP